MVRGESSGEEENDEFDQCVFLRGYRMKERLRPLPPSVMKAAADPPDFERHDDDTMEPSIPVEEDCEDGEQRPEFVLIVFISSSPIYSRRVFVFEELRRQPRWKFCAILL